MQSTFPLRLTTEMRIKADRLPRGPTPTISQSRALTRGLFRGVCWWRVVSNQMTGLHIWMPSRRRAKGPHLAPHAFCGRRDLQSTSSGRPEIPLWESVSVGVPQIKLVLHELCSNFPSLVPKSQRLQSGVPVAQESCSKKQPMGMHVFTTISISCKTMMLLVRYLSSFVLKTVGRLKTAVLSASAWLAHLEFVPWLKQVESFPPLANKLSKHFNLSL